MDKHDTVIAIMKPIQFLLQLDILRQMLVQRRLAEIIGPLTKSHETDPLSLVLENNRTMVQTTRILYSFPTKVSLHFPVSFISKLHDMVVRDAVTIEMADVFQMTGINNERRTRRLNVGTDTFKIPDPQIVVPPGKVFERILFFVDKRVPYTQSFVEITLCQIYITDYMKHNDKIIV